MLCTSATALRQSIFNFGTLEVHAKTIEQLFRDLLFPDDAALVADTERALQHHMSCFAEAAQLFGLDVNLKKTEASISLHPEKSTDHPTSLS